jgi:hypothetical protein
VKSYHVSRGTALDKNYNIASLVMKRYLGMR